MRNIQTERDGYKYLPAKTHDLIIAIARKRCAKPKKTKQQERYFQQQPDEAGYQCKRGHVDGKGTDPPRNMMLASVATRIIFEYSARKNTVKAMPEYSTWNPATISDSPSATSNGARFVSATPDMKYTRNIGNSGMRYQLMKLPPCCPGRCHPDSDCVTS